jgi:hypothetical protein
MSDVNETVYTIVDTELMDAIKRNDIRDMLAAVNEIQSVLLRAMTLNGRCPERFRLVNDIISSIESDCQDNPGQVSDETLRDYDDVFQSFMLR